MPASRLSVVGVVLLALVLYAPLGRAAEEQPTELIGNSYDLFDPVPRDMMRKLAPDRPDIAESPYTVDAGHFQIETDMVSLAEDTTAGVKTQSWVINAINVKVGIGLDTDLQIGIESYKFVKRTSGGATLFNESGVGDVTVRLKRNLFGNDRGEWALALMPFAKVPTQSARLGTSYWEGGTLLPISGTFGNVALALTVGVEARRSAGASAYHAQFLTALSLTASVLPSFDLFGEVISRSAGENGGGWMPAAGGGVIYTVSRDFALDAGARAGLNDAADALIVYSGLTLRI